MADNTANTTTTATTTTIASDVPFHVFAVLCEKISKTQGKEKKKLLMKKFIGYWRDSHQKVHGQQKTVSLKLLTQIKSFFFKNNTSAKGLHSTRFNKEFAMYNVLFRKNK